MKQVSIVALLRRGSVVQMAREMDRHGVPTSLDPHAEQSRYVLITRLHSEKTELLDVVRGRM
jgi:hypothetical protein